MAVIIVAIVTERRFRVYCDRDGLPVPGDSEVMELTSEKRSDEGAPNDANVCDVKLDDRYAGLLPTTSFGGIVSLIPVHLDANTSPERNRQARMEAISLALLFNDQIDVPFDRQGLFADDGEWSEMHAIDGIREHVRKSITTLTPTNLPPRAISRATHRAADKVDPGRWSLWKHRSEDEPAGDKDAETCFRLAIENSLIVPHRSVSLDDLLRFRESRRPELEAFRLHLEELCTKIADHGSIRNARLEAHRFDRAVRDYKAAATGFNRLTSLGRLEIEFKPSALLVAGTAAGSTLAALSHPLAAAAAVVPALASALTLKFVSSPAVYGTATPFKYLVSIDRDLF